MLPIANARPLTMRPAELLAAVVVSGTGIDHNPDGRGASKRLDLGTQGGQDRKQPLSHLEPFALAEPSHSPISFSRSSIHTGERKRSLYNVDCGVLTLPSIPPNPVSRPTSSQVEVGQEH
jgi:hypothetical protein